MKKFFTTTLGKISWEKPTWLSAFFAKCQQSPKKTAGVAAGIFLAIAALIVGYFIYQKMPKAEMIAAQVAIPKIHVDEQKWTLTPQALRIVFNHDGENGIVTSNDPEVGDDGYVSVAPLPQVGKTVTQGIEISPAIEGEWRWENDRALVFMPKKPWPAGTKYTVYFSKSLFAKSYRMPSWNASFTTIPLSISVQSFKFFQDLANPAVYKVAATVNFNYPVDKDSFSKSIKLFYPSMKKSVPYTLSFGKGNFQAYIQADINVLPDYAQYLELDFDKGVKPLDAGSATSTLIQAPLMVPDKNSILKVDESKAVIVRNDKGQPEQILTIETTAGVTTDALKKSLHVYLLPKDYPAVGNMPIQKDYQWHSAGEVSPAMLTENVELQAVPTEQDYETLHSFKIKVEPHRFIYIAIDKGLQSYGDYALALPYAAIVEAPEYPKEINFLHQGSLLALTGEKKVSVVVRGLPAVKFTLARVLPGEINHLITQTSGDFQNPEFLTSYFDASDISVINSEIDVFDNSDKSKAQYIALDLSKYLKQQSFNLGLFLLKGESYDPETKTTTDINNSRLILITDMDMLAKTNADDSRDVYVQSITNGMPVSEARVEVLGRNGVALVTQTTDAEGHVHFPSLKDFKDERAPTVYVVSHENDVSFMPYARADRTLNYSRFDTGGETNVHKYGLQAYLFSDRGIYRPGETIHLGLIAKGSYAASTVAGLPLELIITDPRGMTVYDQKFISNESGLQAKDYSLDVTALTGDYTASLYVTKDNAPDDLLGSTTIQVQEFEPDQLKMTTHFDPTPTVAQGWVSPQNLKAEVELWNLFGTPASNRRVSGKLYFSPEILQFNAYPDYVFSDPYRDPNKPLKTFSENLNDIQTDDKGKAAFNLDLSRYAQSTYQLTLLSQGYVAEGGRGVSQTTSVLVSPLSYLMGYKPDGDLNYIRQHDSRHVNFIAINSKLEKVSVQKLKLKILKLNSVTTLAKQPDGSYQYQTVVQEHEVSEVPLTIGVEGNHYKVPTENIGDYKIQVFDQNGLLLSQFPFSVIGQGEQAVAKNATLTLKLDKKEYSPGETIQLNITGPYAGAGLITIERDKVYAFKWFKMDGASSVETITIPSDFEGTGYVNVALVRDWNSDEIFMNPLSYNVQAFSVIPESRRMNIHLNAPDNIQPGKPLNIEYSSDKSGNIIVYAIDEGILQVANYETPDPLAYYFKKRALSVDTAQIADQILPKYIADRELSAIGGGSEQKSIASNLNPFARKVAPVAFWSGILPTDNQAHHVIYNVPDYFNGTLRLMAVGVSTNAVGSAMKKIISKDDFVLTPNAPTYVAPGDQFEVSVSIANTTNINSSMKLILNPSSNLNTIGESTQSITISPHGEKTVRFNLQANDKLGAGDIHVVGEVGNKKFAREVTLSVRPASPYQTLLKSGYATSNQTFPITRQLYPEFRTQKAEISTNPLILLAGLKDYLVMYPYECTEQLVSRALIQLILKGNGFEDAYGKVIQVLRARQNSDGSFAYWPNGTDPFSNTFSTIYASDFLTEAKLRGQDVPSNVLGQALSYLKDYAGGSVSNMDDARLHAYAIYVLTRNEIVTTDYIANLEAYLQQQQDKSWQKDITAVYLAAAYQMLQNHNNAEKLISGYKIGDPQHQWTNFYSPSSMDAQYIAILANNFPDRLKRLNADQLMALVNSLSGDTLNSLNAAMSGLALSDYAKAQTLNGAENKLSLVALDNAYQFNTKNHTGYFYQIVQAGFDKNPVIKEIKSGLEVYREYQNEQGNTVTSTKLGDTLEVHVKIRATNGQAVNNVAVVDLLPGGFQLVPKSIIVKNGNSGYLNYFDAREDRVIFYVTAGTDVQEYTYRIRAINKGTFVVPPIFAQAMYLPKVTAQNSSGKMVVQ